ncbi:hypothetical protein [Rubrolithibacter danxiaensis]|uniref:hypothetical protein n=1 Tax=Rubrolithibacter danxiaensis TaxID=3390805 RepID=UPI003BF8FD1B
MEDFITFARKQLKKQRTELYPIFSDFTFKSSPVDEQFVWKRSPAYVVKIGYYKPIQDPNSRSEYLKFIIYDSSRNDINGSKFKEYLNVTYKTFSDSSGINWNQIKFIVSSHNGQQSSFSRIGKISSIVDGLKRLSQIEFESMNLPSDSVSTPVDTSAVSVQEELDSLRIKYELLEKENKELKTIISSIKRLVNKRKPKQ